jgi:hypothetical protein
MCQRRWMCIEDVSCSHAAYGTTQMMRVDFKAQPSGAVPQGSAVEQALLLWQLVEHLPVQLAAEALTAAILLRRQEVVLIAQAPPMQDTRLIAWIMACQWHTGVQGALSGSMCMTST